MKSPASATYAARYEQGIVLRRKTPREAQAELNDYPGRNPVALLAEGDRSPRAGARSRALQAHAGEPVHLPARRRDRDGAGPRACAARRHPRPGLRRLPPHELRRLRDAGRDHPVRHQRFRRNAARRRLHRGLEAPRRERRGGRARRQIHRQARAGCRGRHRQGLSPAHAQPRQAVAARNLAQPDRASARDQAFRRPRAQAPAAGDPPQGGPLARARRQLPAPRQGRRQDRRQAADHLSLQPQDRSARARRSAGGVRLLPQAAGAGPAVPCRPLCPQGHRLQGGRGRQRRHVLHGEPVHERRRLAIVPAIQGSTEIRARVPRAEIYRPPRPSRRRRPAHHAGGERHLSGLDRGRDLGAALLCAAIEEPAARIDRRARRGAGARQLRAAVRTHARPRPCALGRSGDDLRLHGQERGHGRRAGVSSPWPMPSAPSRTTTCSPRRRARRRLPKKRDPRTTTAENAAGGRLRAADGRQGRGIPWF